MFSSLAGTRDDQEPVLGGKIPQRTIGVESTARHHTVRNEQYRLATGHEHASHLVEAGTDLRRPTCFSVNWTARREMAMRAYFVLFEKLHIEPEPVEPHPMVFDVVVYPWVRG